MRRLIKKIFIVVILFVMIILVGESKASLQANPNTHYKRLDVLNNWLYRIRNMEKSGEAMGLSETLNEDLTSSSESNNIDVHMMKSTEYGAIAILSASGYGNPQILQESEIKTTTGNKTGIYYSGENIEFLAAGLYGYGTVDGRYINVYSDGYKVGDALGSSTDANPGCRGWHNAGYSDGMTASYPYLLRGSSGIFSTNRTTAYERAYCARGVVVNGTGL